MALGSAASPAPIAGAERRFPTRHFEALRMEGLLLKPFTEEWGIAPGTHATLLQTLRQTGALDLSTGRLYEGHVNAVMLLNRFGGRETARQDVERGHVFGVWNTDAAERVTARRDAGTLRFSGSKAFGSGAGTITRPIVTAEIEGEGRVMCCLPIEQTVHTVDYTSWKPLGMEGSDSFTVEFSQATADSGVLLGKAGDYYAQPWFSGGAIRFAAVHFGAAEQLAFQFYEWIRHTNRAGDPYQQSRAGELALLVESGGQWIDSAAAQAELYFNSTDEGGAARMVHFANMMRLAIENICLDAMQLVTRGVGARGLLEPSPFAKIIRDLTMYLRQPAPDQALAAVGRAALEA